MSITNDPTGRRSRCEKCGATIEEALLLRGARQKTVDRKGREVTYNSPGVPTWRTLDRLHGSARCEKADDLKHVPGKITHHSART